MSNPASGQSAEQRAASATGVVSGRQHAARSDGADAPALKRGAAGGAPAVGFVSLGCPKALVDSERLITELRARGYRIASGYEGADLVVVNTCGFIDAAIDESLEAIGEAVQHNGRVLVTGCLGTHPQRILARHPKVLAVTGPQAFEEQLAAIDAHLPRPHDPCSALVPPHGVRLTPPHYAYLKISEGCNNRCTFCIIPSLRGPLRSRPLDHVLSEAEALVSAGVKELLVISQDTGAYGSDLRYRAARWHDRDYESRFIELARALGTLGVWVRLHYVYPYPHIDEVISLMREPGVLPYLDIPFQHASPSVLRRMRRPAHSEDTLRRIQAWRRACPELTLRSSFIVGFPGESEQEFAELLAWLDEAQLDRVGCFEYSPVEGAAANTLAPLIPEQIKHERYQRFMQRAAAISRARLQARVGRRCRVLIDTVQKGVALGRSSAEAPDIDGVVRVQGAVGLRAGALCEVEITAADTYDLRARMV